MKTRLDSIRLSFQKRIFPLSKPPLQAINIYSIPQFKIQMAIEKRRSERMGNKSSIIFFYTEHFLHDHGKEHTIRVEEIAKVIGKTVRATDVISIFKNHIILILLLDADSRGAECACKRIVQKISSHFSPFGPINPHDLHIKILSFPERKIELAELEKLARTPIMPGANRRSSDAKAPIDMQFKKDYMENLRICISSYNGSVISMRIDNVFFWDQTLASKYILTVKKITKRMMDITGALAAILLLLPFMLLIAIAVKLTSPGPILFKQNRVGYKGKRFTFIKFRSMFIDNDDSAHQAYVRKLINGLNDQINMGTDENPHFKIINDPRVTRLGRFLRRTSLDELPQFFNVLKGEMSLVGPRPPIPYEVDGYKKWHYRRVLEVKPGITGLWQVSGRNQTTFDEMVRLDISYAESWTIKMDLNILFKTIMVVLAGNGE